MAICSINIYWILFKVIKIIWGTYDTPVKQLENDRCLHFSNQEKNNKKREKVIEVTL